MAGRCAVKALITAGVLGIVSLVGCGTDKQPQPTEESPMITTRGSATPVTSEEARTDTPAAPSTTPADSASAAPVASANVPTEEDFEDKAKTTITPANMEQELTKLEKEIGTKK
jgi:hypothetical protein